MNQPRPYSFRLYCTVIACLGEILHLAWEYFHGGVVAHNILARADLPAFSNWWGLLLIPTLTWFLTGLIERQTIQHVAPRTRRWQSLAGFAGALLLGAALSLAFVMKQGNLAAALFMGIFLLSVLIPLYRPEYLLGFVFGMTFTFGSVLPTAIGIAVMVVTATIHLLIYPLLMRIWRGWRAREGVGSK